MEFHDGAEEEEVDHVTLGLLPLFLLFFPSPLPSQSPKPPAQVTHPGDRI